MKTSSLKIKINSPLKNYKAGDIVIVDENSPDFVYWLRRLQDAKIDRCCNVVNQDEENSVMIQSEEDSSEVNPPKSKIVAKKRNNKKGE